MEPSYVKFLLLVLAMLGIGGYVFYATNPAPSKVAQEVRVAPSSTSGALGANVSNVHIQSDEKGVVVTGVAKEVIDPTLTSFSISFQNAASSTQTLTFSRAMADLLVENRVVKGGVFEIDLGSVQAGRVSWDQEWREQVFDVAQYPRAQFVIRRVEKTGVNGAVFVGDLTVRGMTKEVRVPFTRQGGALRGRVSLQPALFDLKIPPGSEEFFLTFSLGVK